ncbi:MAG: hypothetical protein NVS2B7_17050 [Herpetosiphon sp.]
MGALHRMQIRRAVSLEEIGYGLRLTSRAGRAGVVRDIGWHHLTGGDDDCRIAGSAIMR